MKSIYMFPVQPGRFSVAMPVGARVLSVQVQRGEAQMWAVVDTDAPTERRYFDAVGTGWDIGETLCQHGAFIGTFQLNDGALVFHLFEKCL